MEFMVSFLDLLRSGPIYCLIAIRLGLSDKERYLFEICCRLPVLPTNKRVFTVRKIAILKCKYVFIFMRISFTHIKKL